MKKIILTISMLTLVSPAPAQAQVEKTKATLRVDLKRDARKYRPKKLLKAVSVKRGDFRGSFFYQAAATRALLPLRDDIRRCVDVQRFVTGELSDRLDFFILPSGKLKKFKVRRSEAIHACLQPHLTRIKFPRFTGRKTYKLQVLVASQGYRIGRRTKAKVIDAYPVGTKAEKKKYRIAAGWVVGTWTHAMSTCAEWVDQSMGAGYTVWFELGLTPAGKPKYMEISVEGEQAKVALKRLAPCVVPLAKGIRAPRHKGKGLFRFRSGTRTASWQRD